MVPGDHPRLRSIFMTALSRVTSAVLVGFVVTFAANLGAQVAPPTAANRLTPAPPQARRLWTGDTVNLEGSPSPDARLYAFPLRSDLAVRDLGTGEIRIITARHASSDSAGSAGRSIFSPDGSRIAYGWYSDDNSSEVRVTAVDPAADRRTIYHTSTAGSYVAPFDWTPDGRAVAATVRDNDGTSRIVLVPSAGGPPRTVQRFPDWRYPWNLRVSPDGRLIAYQYPPTQRDGRQAIYVVPIDGGSVVMAMSADHDNRLIGWTPDGRDVVFGSDLGGSPSVWSIGIEAGKPAGNPHLIRRDLWRAEGMHLTAQGALFYGVRSGDLAVLTVPYDPRTGQVGSRPRSLSSEPGYDYAQPYWSPRDGYVVYLTWSSGIISTTITIQSATNGGVSSVLNPLVRGLQSAVWTADGDALILMAIDAHGDDGLLRLDLRSNAITRLTGPSAVAPDFSRDGKWLYYVPSHANFDVANIETRPRIVAHDLASGVEHDVYVAPEGTIIPGHKRMIVSPDGKRILLVTTASSGRGNVLQLVDVATGRARPLLEPPFDVLGPGIASGRNAVGFTRDGRYALFVAGGTGLWRVPLAGGKPDLHALSSAGPPRISPDGRQLVYVAGELHYDLWVLHDPALGFHEALQAPGH